MLNKRGELTTKEIIEIILGAAVFLLLALFLYQLISPNFSRVDETAESYLDNFVEQVAIADSRDVSSFSIWQSESKKDKVGFHLVYFGNRSSYGEQIKFYSLGNNLNRACVCSLENRETKCDECKNLKYPILASGLSKEDYGSWAIGVGEKIEITKGEGFYEIKRV